IALFKKHNALRDQEIGSVQRRSRKVRFPRRGGCLVDRDFVFCLLHLQRKRLNASISRSDNLVENALRAIALGFRYDPCPVGFDGLPDGNQSGNSENTRGNGEESLALRFLPGVLKAPDQL
ncbi:hypothetical protein, partial [Rhizobium changzhiense]|uniref:hypothetical protein n=1 Tax=Rhizobium changzhiense TaxID=2692317 RepID=UPI0019D68FFB